MGRLWNLSERILRVIPQHDKPRPSMGTPVPSTGA